VRNFSDRTYLSHADKKFSIYDLNLIKRALKKFVLETHSHGYHSASDELFSAILYIKRKIQQKSN
jgi:hypothetical protein